MHSLTYLARVAEGTYDGFIYHSLGLDVTSIPVGATRVLIVGADGVVRDDSWIEVFAAETGTLAIVQASGPDYLDALARALSYPDDEDQDGDSLTVSSGELAIFDAADDGDGRYSGPLVSAEPGPVPTVHGPPSREADPGLLILTPHIEYRLKVRLVYPA